MTPIVPHMVTALYAWICQNDMTPRLLVNTTVDGVIVPAHLIQDDKIVLSIAVHSIDGYHIDDEAISFSASFSGVADNIYLPIDSIMSIFAKETGQGMVFSPEQDAMNPPEPTPPSGSTKPEQPISKPKLRIF